MENAQATEVELTPAMRALLTDELARHGETENDIVASVVRGGPLAYPTVEAGSAWTVWTKRRAYFPVGYAGAEWADSVPRNPSNELPERHGND